MKNNERGWRRQSYALGHQTNCLAGHPGPPHEPGKGVEKKASSPQPAPPEEERENGGPFSVMKLRLAHRFISGLVLVGVGVLLSQRPAYAGGTVNDCSSLTNFLAALNGGGTVTFSCSGTIVLTKH